MRFAPTSFRPAFGRVLSVVVVVIAAAGLVSFAAVGDWLGLVRYGWVLALLGVAALAVFWFPRLDVAEHEVTVRNVFSTVHVPWPAIERVDTKWALALHTAQGTVTVWASPAPNRYASAASNPANARISRDQQGFAPRPGDLPETESGAAAYVIRQHWEDLRADGLLGAGAEPGSVRRDIHWGTIAVLGALLLASALGILL